MSRRLFALEKGIRVYKTNSATEFIDYLWGTSLPGGDAGEQDAAPIGSQYNLQNGTSSKIYTKITNVGATSDWIAAGSGQAQIFRNEKIRAVTNDTVTAGVARDLGASPFADDEGTQLAAADFQVGEFIIADADGSPVLLEVTNVSAPNVTFSTPDANLHPVLSEGDAFIAINYLPDTPDDQEKQSLVQYNGSIIIKIGDFNWDFADGINLQATIVDRNGPVAGSDTVQVGIEKLEGDAKDVHAALGIARGDVNFGAFTSPASLLLAASQTAKALFQRVGVLLAQLRGVEATGVTTSTALDAVPHATVKCCKWLVHAVEDATPTKRESFEVFAHTDGTTVDSTLYGKLKLNGGVTAVSATVAISGANLELQVSASNATTFTARRIEVVKSVL